MSSTVTIQQNLGLEKSRYSNQSDKSPLISDLIKAISDDKALTIFNTVALNAGKTDLLISTLGYWKLKAIDSLQTPGGLPEFEVNKLIDSLVENSNLKNIILAKVK
jgi:hypothetical protein